MDINLVTFKMVTSCNHFYNLVFNFNVSTGVSPAQSVEL